MKNYIKQFSMFLFGKQLRKPAGFMAKKVGNKMNIANASMYDKTLECLQLKTNESVLEIGYGNGKLFEKILEKADGLSVSGIDYSKDMYQEALLYNKPAIEMGKLVLHFGNSAAMPFNNTIFDKVFCINVVYFWDEPQKHLSEIYRVLKVGGHFYTTIRRKEDMLHMPFTKHGFTLYTSDAWKLLLEANGFFVDAITKITEPAVEVKGKTFQLESVCIAARKV